MALPSPVVVAAAAGAEGAGVRARFEVADVVRAYGDEYVRTHPNTEARRVLRAIAYCRTAALGGHVEQCEGCGQKRMAYNSCRNRHGPKCQGNERARWMAAEPAMLLPVPYFHVVFTLPHALNALVRVNRRRLYARLFRLAATTLHTFARDPHPLGAEPAVTMVLHTWGHTLTEPPTCTAWSRAAGSPWMGAPGSPCRRGRRNAAARFSSPSALSRKSFAASTSPRSAVPAREGSCALMGESA